VTYAPRSPFAPTPPSKSAPKAEFLHKHDTFTTNGDDGDDCSLGGEELTFVLSEQDGERSRCNSLPAMRASAEFANLYDLECVDDPEDNEADVAGKEIGNKDQERKWWWQKSSAEETDEKARAMVLHDDSDNCAGARHGEDGEETTRDAEVINRRRSLDHQPIMGRASIGGMFGGGWTQPQQAQKEELEVDAEQAWANATWSHNSTRRVSDHNALVGGAIQSDRQQRPQQLAQKPRTRRATISFGIMGEMPAQQDMHDAQAPTQPQNNKLSSFGLSSTSLLRGISGAAASESKGPTVEELEQKRRAKELEDQNLSDMLAMLKAHRNSERAGPANKTCTNVANAIIVKEYMEVQRRASMSFTETANSSSATSEGLVGNDSQRITMPKRTSMGFNILGGFGRNSQEQKEQGAQQPNNGHRSMTELQPVRPLAVKSYSLRQVTGRSSSLIDGDSLQSSPTDAAPEGSSGAVRRSSMH
jgi:hypothetical protein